MSLVVDAGVADFLSERDDHGPAAGGRFLRCDESALGNSGFQIRLVFHEHLGGHAAQRVGREVLPGPLVMQFQVVERLSENVGSLPLQRHRQMGEHLRKLASSSGW